MTDHRPARRLLVTLAVALLLGSLLPGEPGRFFCGGWLLAPFATLAMLARLGPRHPWAVLGAAGITAGLLLAIAGINVLLLMPPGMHGAHPPLPQALGMGLTSLAAALTFGGIAALCPPPGNPHPEPIHRLAAGLTAALTAAMLVPLAATGETPISRILSQPAGLDQLLDERGAPGLLADELYGLIWTLAAAAFAVGYGIDRSGAQTLARLGLAPPVRRTLWAGFAGMVALLLGSAVLDPGIESLWKAFGWPLTGTDTIGQLFKAFSNPVGAVIVGISAGLGEEVAIRGILQPRVGLLASNLLFTALHAYQYHWDALASVFLIGLCLGAIRHRWNTTAAALAHGGYDFVLLMHEWLSSQTPGTGA